MGGAKISIKTKLTIIRNGPGDYEYEVEETVIDEMYGGVPKTNKNTMFLHIFCRPAFLSSASRSLEISMEEASK